MSQLARVRTPYGALWIGERDTMKDRLRKALARPALEREAVIFEVVVMLAAALAFHFAPNERMFAHFSRELNAPITSDLFAGLCLLFTLLALAIGFAPTRKWERWLYVNAALPLLLYTTTYGLYLWLSGTGIGLGIVVYPFFYWAFRIIAKAVFRDCPPPERE
jgi:hypothetical protein